jgi:Ca2+-transporting ATPase
VVTVALAMGAHRMADRNAVVRNLPAVETLGSVTVVATDKTGTLTEGRMFAELVWTPAGRYRAEGVGYAPSGAISPIADAPSDSPALRRLLRDVVLCNDAALRHDGSGYSVLGDPLEGALLALAGKGGIDSEAVRAGWPRVGEQPFDHRTRRMVTRHRSREGRTVTVCKGAPEAVLAALPGPTRDAEHLAAVTSELAEGGFRVIAVADDECSPGSLEVVGLVAIGDPPREQSVQVVSDLRRAGIGVVLVTGDHARTAEAIARRVGIASPEDQAVEGAQLTAGRVRDGSALTVVARVQPDQKVSVVEALQSDGQIVAMLGDGVNDAPALRRADIGVAAGRTGTEVAKEAADLVLMDDDLGTVVSAVREGRRIFANIRAFLVYAISGGLAEVGVMLLGPATGLTLPLLPGQILWINLLTHGLTGVAFGAEPADPEDMSQPPRPPSESVFTRSATIALAVSAVSLTAVALVAGAWGDGTTERRTAIFVALGLGQLGVALALRSRGRRRLRQRGLELAVATAATLQVGAAYVPWLHGLLDTTSLAAPLLVATAAVAVLPGLVVRLVRYALP